MNHGPAGDTLKNIEAAFAPLKGKRLLDIGCGPGQLVNALMQKGARIAGIDRDERAVAAARSAFPRAFVRQACAEALPFPDAAFDGAIFLNSLHHVPIGLMPMALAEALRVVGREGSVLVIEPLAEGSFFEALRPLEDEEKIRNAAQKVIAQVVASGGVTLLQVQDYERVEVFATLDHFIDRILDANPDRRERLDDAREKITLRFNTLAEREARGYALRQPLRLHRFCATAGFP